MRNYVIRRILIAIPVIFAITLINFSLMHLAPGNPLLFMLTMQGTGSMSAQQAVSEFSGLTGDFLKKREHELGLDQPLVVQYVNWLGQIAHGDLGRSMQTGELIAPEMLLRLGVTVQLTIPSLIISVTLGILLGTLAAVHQNSWFDQVVSFFTYVLMAVPGFMLGLGAIAIVALQLKWLPFGTMYDPATNGALGDRLLHLIMPLTVIGISGSVGIIRFTRTSVLEVMRQEYVTVARAKGIGESAIRARHIFKNALVPVLTIVGYHLPGLFGGSALFETVFLFPGLGQWAANSASAKDYPVMMVVITVTAILIVLSNLLVDIAYAAVDPRITYS
jgi:peptide/nickel transport system permease protein